MPTARPGALGTCLIGDADGRRVAVVIQKCEAGDDQIRYADHRSKEGHLGRLIENGHGVLQWPCENAIRDRGIRADGARRWGGVCEREGPQTVKQNSTANRTTGRNAMQRYGAPTQTQHDTLHPTAATTPPHTQTTQPRLAHRNT